MSSDAIVFAERRFFFVLCCILIAFISLGLRVFDLAILDQPFLRHQGDERVLRFVKTPPLRGMIMDRNGSPLAVSIPLYSVWANPQFFAPNQKAASKLSLLLQVSPKKLRDQVNQYKKKKREFVYLKRGLSPELANQVMLLGIPGLYTNKEYRRYYPEGEVTSHVIGFTDVDDKGQEGLELAYEKWLSGLPGKKWVVKDRLGRVIDDVKTVTHQVVGRDLSLSIDRRIQYHAYRELLTAMTEQQAEAASAIILDVKTGEVLAMVNQPSFNPNNRSKSNPDHYRNRALTDTFEPGSTIKSFFLASALESGQFTPDSLIDTSPGILRIGHNIVRDEKNYHVLSMKEILERSSNVGVAKMAFSLPQDQYINLLERFGFGELTGIGFPGEQNGVLNREAALIPFQLATLSFGYALSVTAIQLALAYAVLANDGMKLPLSLLKLDKLPIGERVLSENVAKQMLQLLEFVVAEGTGRAARVPGYRVAGKTGTTRQIRAGCYQKTHHTSSFVGIAPLNEPRLVVAVVIHDPQGKDYLGGLVAAPVFAKIMGGALRILDIPPDAPVN